MKQAGSPFNAPFIAFEPNIPRTIEIYTDDLSTTGVYEVEITAILNDSFGNNLVTLMNSFEITVVPCQIDSFDLSFPSDSEIFEYIIDDPSKTTNGFAVN